MRHLTYYVACSLDGFIAHLDGSHDGFSQNPEFLSNVFEDFPETLPTHFRGAMGIQAENRWFDTVLMGRNTYEIGLKDGVTSPYAHLRQYLFSQRMHTSPDEAVTLVREDAIAQVKRLKSEPGKGIWLCGGANLASTLFTAGLIDNLIIKVNPFLMGSGIPLFSEAIQQTALELTDSKTYVGGVVRLHYRVEI